MMARSPLHCKTWLLRACVWDLKNAAAFCCFSAWRAQSFVKNGPGFEWRVYTAVQSALQYSVQLIRAAFRRKTAAANTREYDSVRTFNCLVRLLFPIAWECPRSVDRSAVRVLSLCSKVEPDAQSESGHVSSARKPNSSMLIVTAQMQLLELNLPVLGMCSTDPLFLGGRSSG